LHLKAAAMKTRWLTLVLVGVLLALLLTLALPSLARADGGPIIPDPELWAMIDEGQQIAVVHLEQDGTARVDLFISMADRSGQSHEVTFFLPLGVESGDFGVVEDTSLAFDRALTEPIEAQLKAERRAEADFGDRVRTALLLGALPAHGAWSWLAALPSLLGGLRMGGMGAAPVATFDTPGSQVSIYDINAATDLQALIETAGLDLRVEETLAALKGQQIAVVRLQAQPVAAVEEPAYPGEASGQPGIHLGWRSTLVSHSAEASYTYPLGTGKAWASPIEVTRVYVVSPVELDFRVDYPRLGEDLSGLEGTTYGALAWKNDKAKGPAFAVDEAYGDFGHIWRATYVQSNSAQDLVVTRLEGVSREMQRAARHARVRRVVGDLSWPICLLAGTTAWVTAWRVVIPRRLGVPYRWRQWKLYRDALAWAGLYVAVNLAILVVVACLLAGVWPAVLASLCPTGLVVVVIAVPLICTALGLVNAYFYARSQAARLQVARGRAFGAYLLVVLMANALYLAFALGYAAIFGAF
jgi:hypothetical protein